MTISRRHALAGALALAVIATMPAAAAPLTSDERFILNALGAHATTAQRAWTLETYREGTPTLRKAMRYVAALTPEQARFLADKLDGAPSPTA